MARLVLLVLASLAALADPPAEHRARERIAAWDAVEADPGPTVRELDPAQRIILYRPTELTVTRVAHADTPEAVIAQRLESRPLGGEDSLRRTHLGGKAAWELASPSGISWYLSRRSGTLELTVAWDAASPDARAQRLAKRLVFGIVPLSSGWDEAFEAWRAELARRAPVPTPEDLLAAELAQVAIITGPLESAATPGETFRKLAERSPLALADALVHVHPEIRVTSFRALLPRLDAALATTLRERMLDDGDLAMRWMAAFAITAPEGEPADLAARAARARELVTLRVMGDERGLKGATQLYALLPTEAQLALGQTLAESIASLPPAGQTWLVRSLAALPEPSVDARLAAWADGADPRLARLARQAWLARGGAHALERALTILGDPTGSRDTDDAIAALGLAGSGEHAKPLDRVLSRFEKGELPPALGVLRSALVPLEAYLKGVGKRTTPTEECADLAPRLARGEAREWMRARYLRLCHELARPSAAGTLLAAARLPSGPGKLVDALNRLTRLEHAAAPGTTLIHGTMAALHALAPEAFDHRDDPGRAAARLGVVMDQPVEWAAWRPAPGRPFDPANPLAAPFPMALRCVAGDPVQLVGALARSSPSTLLGWNRIDRVDEREASYSFGISDEAGGISATVFGRPDSACGNTVVLAATPEIAHDAALLWRARDEAAAAAPPETIATLDLAFHAYIALLDPPMILGKSAELAIASQLTGEASLALEAERLVARARLRGIPAPFAGILADAPRARLRAPAAILPGDACGALAISIDPAAVVSLVRHWPLKWYQKPAGLLAGSQMEAIDRWVSRLGSECGVVLLPLDGRVEPLFYVALSNDDRDLEDLFTRVEGQDLGGAPLWTRGGLYARSTKGFLCVARSLATLALLDVGPKLADTPMWRDRAPASGSVIGIADPALLANARAIPAPLAALGEVSLVVERTGGTLALELRHARDLPARVR